MPSPSGSEATLARTLAARLDAHLDEVRVDEAGNLVARHGRGPRAVTFLGHLDTVPGDVPVEEREERLYGRGAVDAKGPLCAALAAVARLPDEAREALTVRVVGAVGEEAPGSPGARHVVTSLPAPDLLVICEPSGWDAVTLGYKGHLRIELSCERRGAHAAGPEPSATDRVVDALGRVRAAVDVTCGTRTPHRAFEALTATVLDVERRHDGLRERTRAVVGLRLPSAWPPERVEALLEDALSPTGVEWTVVEALPAVRGPSDGALARAFRVAIRAHGGRPRRVVKTGTSDWNVVAPSWAVPTLAYGPGDAALDHAPNEHLAWSEYDAAVGVIAAALDRLGGDGK